MTLPTISHFGRDPISAREGGFQCLTPFERQFAMEFVVTGSTLDAMARQFDMPIKDIRRVFNDPVVRAFIADLQAEVLQHRLINEQWVEGQILKIWPQLIGEVEVPLIDKSGNAFLAKKMHSSEVTSILKHFGGNSDQKKASGVHVQINFGAMGVLPPSLPEINIIEKDDE